MSDLTQKSMKELVELYNENAANLGEKPVKKFSDKKTAIRRTTEIIARRKGGAQEPAAPTSPEEPKAQRKSRADFNLEPGEQRTIRAPQEGKKPSKRYQVLLMLERGTTIEEVMEAIGWDRRTAYDGIRLINKYSGRALVQDENGVITLGEQE